MRTEKEKIKELERVLKNSKPVLFTGAGFSYETVTKSGSKVLVGDMLRKNILENFLEITEKNTMYEELSKYDLKKISKKAKKEKGDNFTEYLIKIYKEVVPNDYHKLMLRYEWNRIYTTNIDDLIERIFRGKLLVQNENREIINDYELEYIKLHGCVNKPEYGFVFTNDEYRKQITGVQNFKMMKLSQDIQDKNFIFVGTSFQEDDIEFYLEKFEDAGFTRKGSMIFIDPYPSIALRDRIEELGGVLIEWDTKKFLEFISSLNINIKEEDKRKTRLNYAGFHVYDDLKKAFSTDEHYESKLYHGENCRWEDVFHNWIISRNEEEEVIRIKKMIENDEGIKYKNNIHCIVIYGLSFVGKTCLSKKVVTLFEKDNYEIIEFKGTRFSKKELVEYINNNPYKDKFILIIDNGSYYYNRIEELMKTETLSKKLIIISTSRNYHHQKRRYYLEGENFDEIELNDRVNRKFANVILSKLNEKGSIGTLKALFESKPDDAVDRVLGYKTLMELLTVITKGVKHKEKVKNEVKKVDLKNEAGIFISYLTLFDMLDLPEFKNEYLSLLFSSKFNELYDNKEIENIIKNTQTGFAIRNQYYLDNVYQRLTVEDKLSLIYNLVTSISANVSENIQNDFRIIFEAFTNVENLHKRLRINFTNILNLLYKLKNEYGNISYYWLQLGIAEQKLKHFDKARIHLDMALSLRPTSYKIMHSVARNAMKQGVECNDFRYATDYFDEGKSKMRTLILNKKWEYEKALSFSVHSYINETRKFASRHNLILDDESMSEMIGFIKVLYHSKYKNDEMAESSLKMLYSLAIKEDHKKEITRLINNYVDNNKRLAFLTLNYSNTILEYDDDVLPIE